MEGQPSGASEPVDCGGWEEGVLLSIAAGFKTRNTPGLHTHAQTHTHKKCVILVNTITCVRTQPKVQGVTPHPSAVLFISLDTDSCTQLFVHLRTPDWNVLISVHVCNRNSV